MLCHERWTNGRSRSSTHRRQGKIGSRCGTILTGLDWTDKYPSAIAALANIKAKTGYLDGELCGVDDAVMPTC
jgi:ATP-dependent DNA ligase